MPRLNVWIPEELAATVREQLPGVNVSKVLQEQFRRLLGCKHERVVCEACNEPVDRAEIVDKAKSEFYSQLLWELEDLVHDGGTAEGAARVAKSVAEAHRISAVARPLPRPSRLQRKRFSDRLWLEDQRRREREQELIRESVRER